MIPFLVALVALSFITAVVTTAVIFEEMDELIGRLNDQSE